MLAIESAYLLRLVRFVDHVLPERANDGDVRLFVSRGAGKGRGLTNEQAVVDLCTQHGFEVVDPGSLTWVATELGYDYTGVLAETRPGEGPRSGLNVNLAELAHALEGALESSSEIGSPRA